MTWMVVLSGGLGLLAGFLGLVGAIWGLAVGAFGLVWALAVSGVTVGLIVYSGRIYGPVTAFIVAGRLAIALPIGGAYTYLIASLMRFSIAAGAWNEVIGSLLAIVLTGYVAFSVADPEAPLRQALMRPALLGCGVIIGCWFWPAVTMSIAALIGGLFS